MWEVEAAAEEESEGLLMGTVMLETMDLRSATRGLLGLLLLTNNDVLLLPRSASIKSPCCQERPLTCTGSGTATL